MKILFLYHHLPHPDTGGGIITVALLQALKSYPIKIHLAALNTNKFYRDPNDVAHLAEKIITLPVNIDIRLLAAAKNFIASSIPYNLERYDSNEFRILLRELAKKEQYDLIHIDATQMGIYINELKRFRCPILLRPHNVEYEIFLRLARNHFNLAKRFIYSVLAKRMKKFEAALLKQVDALVPLTQRDLNLFYKLGYQGPAQIVPVGEWEKACTYIPIEEETRTVGFIGSLNWAPNLEGLVWFFKKVVPLLREQDPKIQVEIAGRFPPPWLKKYRSPNINIIGPVPDAKAFLKKHAVIISPLLSGSGMRVKIIEAMSQSKYVVSTTIGAEGIADKDSDFIRIADTPKDFANKILEGLNDHDLRRKIKQNAYQKIKDEYTWEKNAEKIWNFYKNTYKKI